MLQRALRFPCLKPLLERGNPTIYPFFIDTKKSSRIQIWIYHLRWLAFWPLNLNILVNCHRLSYPSFSAFPVLVVLLFSKHSFAIRMQWYLLFEARWLSQQPPVEVPGVRREHLKDNLYKIVVKLMVCEI